jgi:hypothetical protein
MMVKQNEMITGISLKKCMAIRSLTGEKRFEKSKQDGEGTIMQQITSSKKYQNTGPGFLD